MWICLLPNNLSVCVEETELPSCPQGENRKCFVAKSLIAEVEQLLPQEYSHPKMLSTWHTSLSWSWSGLSFLPTVLNRSIFMELFRKSNMFCTYILLLMFLLAKEKSQFDSLCFPHILPKWHRIFTSTVATDLLCKAKTLI